MNGSEKKLNAWSKQHPPYKLRDGTRVPGVTTIVGVLNKPALVKWANKLGLQGIDSTKYVDALAAVGTLAHAMILADLRAEDPAALYADYDKATVDLAENCFLSFLSWKKGKAITPTLIEVPLVSETLRFGGRADFYGYVDGRLALIDFKTGKGIWPEHWYQLAGYALLLAENGYPAVADYRMLNIPRAETESFDERSRAALADEEEIFRACLRIYELRKRTEK